DVFADVVLSQVNVPDGAGELGVLDGEVGLAGHGDVQTDAGQMRQADVVALAGDLGCHQLHQHGDLVVEALRVVGANGGSERLGHVLALDVALHDQVQTLVAIGGGDFLGAGNLDALLHVAGDGVDVEDVFRPHGGAGDDHRDLLAAEGARYL